jgi:hypothetical protein
MKVGRNVRPGRSDPMLNDLPGQRPQKPRLSGEIASMEGLAFALLYGA